MFSWENKVVWITGSSSGIGEALSRKLAATGCKLALTARRPDILEILCESLKTVNQNVQAFPGDVTRLEDTKIIASQIELLWGQVDIFIGNAGIYYASNPTRFSSKEHEEIMQVNYLGIVHGIESVLPGMIQRKNGWIVGVSSLTGYRGLPTASAYGASKAAVINLLESLRFDIKQYNIRVTIVNPGFVRTPMTAKNRFPMPFLIEPNQAAEYIIKGLEKGSKEIYFPPFFSWILKFLRILPFGLYEYIITKRTKK